MTAWDDPSFAEPSDTAWAAGYRWLQSWWRETQLRLPPGPIRAAMPDRVVSSMLPLYAPANANFLTPAAVAAVERRHRHPEWGGLVQEDRLRRNLLSSQPLCFNLFGHLYDHHAVLIEWLATLGIEATDIVDVRVEWAPPRDAHLGGGSAFDAFIHHRGRHGEGFLGIETKYAENLAAQSITERVGAYAEATRDPRFGFRPGADVPLTTKRTVQLWLNALLARSLLIVDDGATFTSGMCVAIGSRADRALVQTTDEVRAQHGDPDGLLVSSDYESLLAIADRHPGTTHWAGQFRRRYLDVGPVAHLLRKGDPRRL